MGSEGGPNTVFCLFSSWIQPVGHQLSLQPERLCLHPIDLVLTANEKSNDGHRFLIPIHLGMAFGPEMTLAACPVPRHCFTSCGILPIKPIIAGVSASVCFCPCGRQKRHLKYSAWDFITGLRVQKSCHFATQVGSR